MPCKYFSDVTGEPVELEGFRTLSVEVIAERWPGAKPKGPAVNGEHLAGRPIGGGDLLPVTRVIEFKTDPTRHACDARCRNASGRSMKCQCSCEGKNHGRGGA